MLAIVTGCQQQPQSSQVAILVINTQRFGHRLFEGQPADFLKFKTSKLTRIIPDLNPDFLVLSEIMHLGAMKSIAKTSGYKVPLCPPEPFTRKNMQSWTLYKDPWTLKSCQWVEVGRDLRKHQLTQWRHPNGQTLALFAVHLPAAYHRDFWRQKALNSLDRAAANIGAELIVAAGDFNITANKSWKFYRKHLSPNWKISHFEACHTCLGTYFYKESWSFLDAILIYRNKNWNFDREKTRTIPWPEGKAASDHLPLFGALRSSKPTGMASLRKQTSDSL